MEAIGLEYVMRTENDYTSFKCSRSTMDIVKLV